MLEQCGVVSVGRTLLPQNLAVHTGGSWLFFQEALTMEELSRTLGHAVHHLDGISQQRKGGFQLFGCLKKAFKTR